MFRRRSAVAVTFAETRSSLAEGMVQLNAMKLADLRKLKSAIEKNPGKCADKIQMLNQLGILLSADWDTLRFQSPYSSDVDKLMEKIGVMLPVSVLEWKSIREKLLELSDIYSIIDATRSKERMESEITMIESELLPDLNRRLTLTIKNLGAFQDNDEVDSEEMIFIEKKNLLEFEIEEMQERLSMLRSQMHVYGIYGRAISDIYSSIVGIQANPTDIRYPCDWLNTVCVQLVMQSSADPATKASVQAVYGTVRTFDSFDSKDINRQERAHILIKAVMHDYLSLRDRYGNKNKIRFETFLNDNAHREHPARKLGLILKVASEHYPDAIPKEVKDDVAKFGIQTLKNPYKDFLAHVTPLEQPGSRRSGSRK